MSVRCAITWTLSFVACVAAAQERPPVEAPESEPAPPVVTPDWHERAAHTAPAKETRPAKRSPRAADVQRALARYAHEPSVDAVLRAALKHFPRTDTEALASRARTAGWVPTVRLGARRGQAVDLSSSVDDAVRLSTDDDLTLSGLLTFELDRVVFRREEVSLARTASTERRARQDRIEQVVHLYFLRRRLQVERDLGVGDQLGHAVEIARIEALLDAFTSGEFLRMMDASSRANAEPPRTPASLRRGDR
jgi:hypothetical protein